MASERERGFEVGGGLDVKGLISIEYEDMGDEVGGGGSVMRKLGGMPPSCAKKTELSGVQKRGGKGVSK